MLINGQGLAHTNLSTLINDIAVLNSLGVKLVIAFGAQQQISERFTALSITSQYYQHLRVTPAETMPLIKEIVGGLGIDLEAKLSLATMGSAMHGSQLQVCQGNFITAKPIGVINGQNLGYTGSVRKVHNEAIQKQLNAGHIVLLSCLGYSPTGETFNLSIEEVASETAISLGAEKLIIFNEPVRVAQWQRVYG